MSLERDSEIEHRFLQQAALRADLIRGDRFVLGAERGVENADVAGSGVAGRRSEDVAAGEQGNRGAGQNRARAHEHRAACGDNIRIIEKGHGEFPCSFSREGWNRRRAAPARG